MIALLPNVVVRAPSKPWEVAMSEQANTPQPTTFDTPDNVPDNVDVNLSTLVPNLEAAIRFLQWLAPKGPWPLYAIHSSRGGAPELPPLEFGPNALGQVRGWISVKNGEGFNIYYMANRARDGFRGKAKKSDVEAATFAYVDIDPREGQSLADEQARIRHLLTQGRPQTVPAPSAIVFSGGGYQALYRLNEPFVIGGNEQVAAEYEAHNRGLEKSFNADNCHNCDRILRLPGTINWPDEKKRRKGRVPAQAHVVGELGNATVRLDQLPKFSADNEVPGHVNDASIDPDLELQRLDEIAALDQWNVPDRVKAIVADGSVADKPKTKDDSRSGWLYDAVCNLKRCSVPDAVVLGIIMDERWSISTSVLEKGRRARKYAIRQIEKAKKQVELEQESFVCNDDGKPYVRNQKNIAIALARLGIEVAYDELGNRIWISGLATKPEEADDTLMTHVRLLFDRKFGFLVPKDFFFDVVGDIAFRNRYHPVREYLDSLEWDHQPRLSGLLVDYCGGADTPLVRAVSRIALIAAVRRVRHPGVKYDEMVVLEGGQGTGKSTFLQILAVNDDWFADEVPLHGDGKATIEALSGVWIGEAAELKGIRKGEVEQLKSFLSRRSDKGRLAYARLSKRVPRQFVLFGTTNSEKYLIDPSGNRRFWPVKTGAFDLEALRRDLDQIWAEAAYWEAKDESIRLDPELWESAEAEQLKRHLEDPYLLSLMEHLGEMRGKIAVEDVFRLLGLPVERRTDHHNRRVGEAMRKIGYERDEFSRNGVRGYAYFNCPKSEARWIDVECENEHRPTVAYADVPEPQDKFKLKR
jgi:predicted P-loop ATPase